MNHESEATVFWLVRVSQTNLSLLNITCSQIILDISILHRHTKLWVYVSQRTVSITPFANLLEVRLSLPNTSLPPAFNPPISLPALDSVTAQAFHRATMCSEARGSSYIHMITIIW